MKVIKWLDGHFEEALLVLLLVLISTVELVQVIMRNIPFAPALTWAEEFCRYCWVWSVFLSLPYTIKTASTLRVTVLADKLNVKARCRLELALYLITAVLMLYLGISSVGVIANIYKSAETSPAMGLPMFIPYSVMLLGFFGSLFRCIQQAVLLIKKQREGE